MKDTRTIKAVQRANVICAHLANGKTYKEIAVMTNSTVPRIEKAIRRHRERLSCSTTIQLVAVLVARNEILCTE